MCIKWIPLGATFMLGVAFAKRDNNKVQSRKTDSTISIMQLYIRGFSAIIRKESA